MLVIPLLSLVLALLWVRRGDTGSGELPAPPGIRTSGDVSGWVGSLQALALEARLVPLHESVRRQEFDREVLADRLALGAGEPWRLVVSYTSADADAPALDPLRVRVVDDSGHVLAPLVGAAPTPPAGGVADPLIALLAPPRERLAAGQTLTLLLWGPRPGSAVRIEGLRRIDGDGAPGTDGELLPPVPLRAELVPAEVLPRTLARLEGTKR